MFMQKNLLVILLLLFAGTTFGQTTKEYQQKYNSGKQLLAQGKYDLAKEVFQPLTQENKANPYAPYAYYYQAYASFKTGKLDQAKLYLQQLVAKFPEWNKVEDAYYLLANVAFEKGDWQNGFSYLEKVKSKEVARDAANLKEHYLLQVTDVGVLKNLQKKFPNDKVLASILVDKLLLSSKAEDVELAKGLDAKFKLNKAKEIAQRDKVSKKEAYNVAVLFPFQFESLNTDKARNNQFVLDMYNGIKQAQEDLVKRGININLYAYDVGNDANKMLDLINSPELSSMDLLIGPLYASTNKVAVSFANQKNVALINPISNSSQLIQNNPASYLLQPSLETQARKTAAYALNTFNPKSAMIFYGNTPKDSLLAYSYQKQVQEKGGKVLAFQKVTQANVQQMVAAINNTPDANVGHIFITTDNQTIAVNFISALEQKLYKTPVVTTSNWLDFRMLTFDQYERRNVHFVHPEFIDYGSDSVKTFKNNYIARRNIVPSIYAYQGYDLMMFFGKQLNEHGTFFHTALHQQAPVEGVIFPGYNYTGANDNQFVPIIKFDKAQLVLANPVQLE